MFTELASNVDIETILSDDDEGGNPMVSKYEDEVDVDNYESVVDIAATRDDSDDSDSEKNVSKKQVGNKSHKNDNTGDEFENFLNDDECDTSVNSLHTDYETL